MKFKSHDKDNFFINFASTYKWTKECLPTKILYPQRKVFFENKEYTTYSDLESYLEKIYEDYQSLPPKEEQLTHLPLEIKF